MSKIRLEQLKVRAYENMVGIVTVNYANHGGKSSEYSPIVRNINKRELNSEMLVMNDKEEIISNYLQLYKRGFAVPAKNGYIKWFYYSSKKIGI